MSFLQHCKNVQLLWHMNDTKELDEEKSLLREKIWFPCIDKMTENAMFPAQEYRGLSSDFYGPLPTGEYLLVNIDEYSRYSIVEIVKSSSASTVNPVIDKVRSMFGIYDIPKSDNGPPFNSEQYSLTRTQHTWGLNIVK